MSVLRDLKPGVGCDRVSREDIDRAKAAADVEALALYAGNLLWALEQVWPMAEVGRDFAISLEDATRGLA